MSASSSASLGFYRRTVTRQFLHYRAIAARPATLRPFSFAAPRLNESQKSPNFVSDKGTQHDTGAGEGTGASRDHALDKGANKDPNVQSHASSAGRDSKADDTGGSATRARDERGSTAQVKKDHPEAPDTVIGMQDERGGKGA